MPRPPGARNSNHDQRRRALAEALGRALLLSPTPLSLRDLAERLDVSPNLLRHYFGDRAGALAAGFEALGQTGKPWVVWLESLIDLPVEEGLRALLRVLVLGWSGGPAGSLGQLHAAGLREGLADSKVGAAYISEILEPTLQPLEYLLSRYAARGELAIQAPRVAALTLLGPLILALLHQDNLNGRSCRPLDVDTFVEELLTGFLRGYQP